MTRIANRLVGEWKVEALQGLREKWASRRRVPNGNEQKLFNYVGDAGLQTSVWRESSWSP